MNKQNLKVLKNLLPHGSIKKIANKTGMSEQSVSKVLDGNWENTIIIKAAITVLKQEYIKIENLLETLKQDEKMKPMAAVA